MIRLIALFCLLAAPVFAQQQGLPDYESTYINDYAGIIDQASEDNILITLEEFRNRTGIELTVLTINRRSDYTDHSSIESFAKDVFNKWGIGDATENDGILLLVARDDREMRIQLGAGYGPVYDGRMQRVIDSIILPEFRTDNYARGILLGVDGIIERLDAEWVNPEDSYNGPSSDVVGERIKWGFFSFIAFIIGWSIFKDRMADGLVRMQRCPKCGRRNLSRTRAVLKKASQIESGSQVLQTRCAFCDYHNDEIRRIPKISVSSSSSGGGSFGGGRSSGGGASGRW